VEDAGGVAGGRSGGQAVRRSVNDEGVRDGDEQQDPDPERERRGGLRPHHGDDRLLEDRPSAGGDRRRIDSGWSPSVLTLLGDRAAAKNNELATSE
jgi:hypothetical protein